MDTILVAFTKDRRHPLAERILERVISRDLWMRLQADRDLHQALHRAAPRAS
jgi:hypothetical protein